MICKLLRARASQGLSAPSTPKPSSSLPSRWLIERAREMGDWEREIQETDGGIMEGAIGTLSWVSCGAAFGRS
jgi:hypothetical protein